MDTCLNIIDGNPCGKSLSPLDKFCPKCGKGVDRRPKPTQNRPKCPNVIEGRFCGWEVDETCRFCPGCGFKLPRSLFNDRSSRVCLSICTDGRTCNTELSPETNFCPKCGNPTDFSAKAEDLKVKEKDSGQSAVHVDGCTATQGEADSITKVPGDPNFASPIPSDSNVADWNQIKENSGNPSLGDSRVASPIPSETNVANSVNGDTCISNSVLGDPDVANAVSSDPDVASPLPGDSDVPSHVSGGPSVASSVHVDPDDASPVPSDPGVASLAPSDPDVASHVSGDTNVPNSVPDDSDVASPPPDDPDVANHGPSGLLLENQHPQRVSQKEVTKNVNTQTNNLPDGESRSDREDGNSNNAVSRPFVNKLLEIDEVHNQLLLNKLESETVQLPEHADNDGKASQNGSEDAKGLLKTSQKGPQNAESVGKNSEEVSEKSEDKGKNSKEGSEKNEDEENNSEEGSDKIEYERKNSEEGSENLQDKRKDSEEGFEKDEDEENNSEECSEKIKDERKNSDKGSEKNADEGKNSEEGSEKNVGEGKNSDKGSEKNGDEGKNSEEGSEKIGSEGKNPDKGSEKNGDEGKNSEEGSEKNGDQGKNSEEGSEKIEGKRKDSEDGSEKNEDDEKKCEKVSEKSGHQETNSGNGSRQSEGGTDTSQKDVEAQSDHTDSEQEEPDVDHKQGDDKDEKNRARKSKRQQSKKTKQEKTRSRKRVPKVNEPSGTKTSNDGKSEETDVKASSAERGASNQVSSAKSNVGKQKKTENTIEVHFHVLLSPLMNFKPETERVVVRFGHDRLGGWNPQKDRLILEVERMDTDGFYQVHGKIDLDRSLSKSSISYKYVICEKDGKTRMEEVKRKHTDNRSFRIPEKYKNEDVWHQYDGVAHARRGSGVIKAIVSYFAGKSDYDQCQEGVKRAMHAFSVKIEELVLNGFSAVEILEQIERVYTCLKLTCLDKDCRFTDEKRFEEHVKEWLEAYWEAFDPGKKNPEWRVVMAMVAICMVSKYMKGTPLSESCSRKICECLLMHPDDQKPEENWIIEWTIFQNHFPGAQVQRDIKKAVLEFCQRCAADPKNLDLSWLYMVPWLHFLNKDAEPGRIVCHAKHNDYVATWWGIKDFVRENEMCKEKLLKKEDTHSNLWHIIEKLVPLFEMDMFLPRTIMALTSPRHLSRIVKMRVFPIDVIIATLFYYIQITLYGYTSSYNLSLIDVWKVECSQALVALTEAMSEFTYRKTEKLDVNRYTALEEEAWSAAMISRDLFKIVRCRDYEELRQMIATACCLQLLCLDRLAELHDDGDQNGVPRAQDQMKTKIVNSFYSCLMDISSYLSHLDFISRSTAEKLEVRDTLLKVKFHCNSLEERCKDALIRQLRESLLQASKQEILDYYCDSSTELNSIHPALAECINQGAFTQLENLLKKSASGTGYDLQNKDPSKFGPLLSKVMQKFWPKNKEDTDEVLRHVLSWSAFPFFLQFYGTSAGTVLTPECTENILCALSLLNDLCESVVSGVLEVWKFKLIRSNLDRWKQMQLIMANKHKLEEKDCREAGCVMKPSCIDKALSYRLAEVQAYEDQRQKIHEFLRLCERIPNVSTDGLKRKCQIEIDRCTFDDICDPKQVHSADCEEYRPQITLLEVAPSLEAALEKMSLQESEVFLELFDHYGQVPGKTLNIEKTITEVFQPAEAEWLKLKKKLLLETLSLKEVDKHFSEEKFDEHKLEEEFAHFIGCPHDEKVKEKVKQVLRYRDLKRHVKSAKTILALKKTLHLTGDFKEMEIIMSSEKRDSPKNCLKSMDKSIEKVTETLKDLDPDRQKCLFVFSQCTPLVEWLGKEIHNQKELKVFVDLASISAGEGDMEIKKVSILHSATTGYSPLLFDLPKDISCKEFLKKCDEVWKALKADPDLPEKLVDLNRHLKWLEMVKASHGSVEVSSLSQAEAINNKGIYWIGSIPKYKEHQKSLDCTIQLTILENKKTETERQQYSYSQLHDLQSRLMLVAGQAEKGKEEVVRFTEVLDSVTRLANAYIKLCQVGSVLFYNLSIVIYNSTQKIVVDFGQDNLRLNTSSKDVNEEAIHLARFLEDCLEGWLQYYGNQRSEYFPLNHYTIEQLVILQGELVRVNSHNHVANTTFPLLECVKPHCTERDLLVAMDNALKKVNVLEEGTSRPADYLESEKAEFVAVIVKAGYSRKDALQALAAVENPADPDAGLMWCLENAGCDSDSDEESGDGTAPKEQRSFEGWSINKASLETVTEEALTDVKKKERTLCEKLTGVWENFLAAVSGSLSNYMSVEHLGIVLSELAQLAPEEAPCKTLPVGFKTGEPNLIVCPQADILGVTLSIYTSGVKEKCPLPTPSEVLLCTVTTTLDQVDIFWRRAIFDPSGKTYCLVNADKLDYDVSDKAERRLEVYMEDPSKNEDYRIVVLCSSEREQRSRIVTALEKYKRPLFTTQESLSKCIEAKLTNEDSHAASCVDVSHCTVRVIKSARAGVGKTLYKNRLVEKLEQNFPRTKKHEVVSSIPLHGKSVDVSRVVDKLLGDTPAPGQGIPRIIHFDVAYEVQEGVDFLLFNLLILGAIQNSKGFIWRKKGLDLYLVETMPLMVRESDQQTPRCAHSTLNFLPSVMCRSPQESLEILMENATGYTGSDRLFDEQEFKSAIFQRPFQYLRRLNHADFQSVNPSTTEGNLIECLEVLLRHCGIPDPSWTELRHFVWFLNVQLKDCESSVFCGAAAAGDLPGFLKFVIRFMIKMSRDFATRSLNISEETPTLCEAVDQVEDEEELLERYQMRRTWESSPHPYIFFNPDHNSMTFLGFNIVGQAGDMVDPMTREILEEAIMPRQLQRALVRNKVPLTENFDNMPREQKLIKLCRVMGIEDMYDPDDTYELTTDNVKKMLAIYMRFRCGIPVIVMGETGCGKTRLVKFLCSLQKPPELETVPNMVLMKVHGGTTEADIISKVKQAEQRAKENCEKYGSNMFTVLFFDEANTTEAIGLIKEIMCDGCMDGEPLHLTSNLKIVAACNPYRKHSDEMIRRLEQAGLGYHVEAEKTVDRLGSVPMRRLVYRVQALPQSLLPLVWDFGQLNPTVEMMYIRQMVLNCFKKDLFEEEEDFIHSHQFPELVTKILAESQKFMRQLQNECSFVSLRDVERTLKVMCWFYEQGQQTELFEKIHDKVREDMSEEDSSETEEEEESLPLAEDSDLEDLVRSLVLAIGTCYHACLSNRSRVNYREHIATFFQELAAREFNEETLLKEITGCQDAFLDEMKVGENIARNQALKENVFMMVVAIELRLPLFLVGKPGSSKSLAKTIVADAMQGSAAHGELFKAFKQVQMVSFQCSPLSTADGIVGTFRQCSQFQKDKNLDQFVSAVVLDEIGLAEDSSKMPLKTLHPLLEDGCQGDEKPEPYKKVAFIGISNWALDPAKMNRGVFVQREVPDEQELKESAEGICSTDPHVRSKIKQFVPAMSAAYLHLFERATHERREFFGLRDFYSLLKMLYGFVKRSNQKLTWFQLQHAIMRNFGGLAGIDPVESFREELRGLINVHEEPGSDDPDCSAAGLIKACLLDVTSESESRYLLLLTENYGALTILQQQILSQTSGSRSPITIFGSSFPKDQEYTQICRNINRIKMCMETGNTVILLNLENLYESLYDALNQYYVYLGGERFVDLGLGTHRVKCRVHKDFRLVVVAEKEVVYDKFPIPLINRMEKHFLTVSTILNEEQMKLASELQRWAENFASSRNIHTQRSSVKKAVPGDAFVGYHADTAPSVILHEWTKMHAEKENGEEISQEQVLQSAKQTLLWCATPDAVCRLKTSRLLVEAEDATKIYFREQKHESLQEYLTWKVVSEREVSGLIQVTSHSKLLSARDMSNLSRALQIPRDEISLLSLQSFDTEQQFCRQLRKFLTGSDQQRLLIIQCDSGDENGSLVASARYCTLDEIAQHTAGIRGEFCILLIVQLPRIAGGCFSGFQVGKWQSVHIDELRAVEENIPDTVKLFGHSIGELLQKPDHPGHVTASQSVASQHRDTVAMNSQHPEPMEVDILERGGNQMDWESETTEGSGPSPASSDPVLDTSMFVHKCLQAAAAMIKDDDDNHSRTTARVRLLFDLLVDPAAGELRFADVINKRLVELLNIREDRLTSLNIARSWLCDEAAQPDVISRAGTLRCSWMQVIENKITPLLAGIIAFMDTNNNLDLLIPGTASGEVSDEASSECEMWKRRLWLMLMNDPDATPLDHKELLSPKRKIELREIYSKLFGFGVTITAPKLPFSWILISKVRSLLKSSPEIRDTDTIAQLVADSGLGRALNSVTEIEHKAELLKYYLQDFISIIHPTSSPCENQLICQSVHTVLMSRDDRAGIISSLVRVHQVYEECQGHLQNFSGLNRVWKDCAKTVDDYLKTNPDHFVHRSPEILIDVLATQQLLENLQPTKDEMDTPRGKKAWLGKVLSVKPVIERVCQSDCEGTSGEEMRNKLRCEALPEIRNTWNRIEVLKLFIDHVCPPDAKEAKKWKFVRCMALWELIKDKVDFKHLPSLEKVEKFLMLSNRGALQHFFGKLQKCKSCTEEMKAVPMLLPCGHVVCVKCCHGFAMADKECPVCHESIPEDYQPKEATDDRKSLEAFSSYQQRCNSFFMALVSQLCFANDSPPDDQVVQKLLTFVTKRFESKHPRSQLRTKEMSVLDTGIDPNPVVRSFLLQLLLRASSEADVIEHLRRFFAQAKEVCMGAGDSQHDTHDQVEMCLLVTQCFEDSYRNKNCVHQSEDEEQEVLCAAQLLKEARRQGVDGDVNVDTLRNIAKVRYGLTVTAKSLQKVFVTGDSTMIPQTGSFRKLVEAARLLCEECGTNWPRIFLMREICRSYGSHSFDEVRKRKLTEWLLPAENTNQEGSADHYVVIGDEYRRLRELLTQVSLGEDIQQLTAYLQTAGMQENVMKTRLLLAVHREITMASVPSEGPMSASSAEIKKKIQDVCLTADTADGDLINRLFDNHVGESCRQLVVNPQQSVRDQHIMCLVFHLMCVVQNPNNSRLLQPIVALARNPHNMIGCYLPTMPEDHLSEVHQALLDARNSATNMGNENPVMYKCPRGHPYVIGDCGRPAVEDVCREPGCGLQIGGAGYNLTKGNTKVGDADRDTTRPGHVLGAPQLRSRHPAPERSLNPASCSIVRALTHMAMYIGANHHSEEVTGLIQSGVTTSLEDFLWDHISVDFDVIQAALGKGFDDVLVLLHHLLDRIHNDVSHGGDAHHNLKNKAGRSKWEEQFNLTYVSPVLSRLEDTVAMLNQKLLNDDRLGGNALMRVLYEADTPEGRTELGNLVEVPAFWRYRSHISLEHLEQVFNQQENQGPGAHSTEQFALLQLFLQQDHVLRAIQYLPSILKLQRLLIQKYQRRIDASEANTMQVYQEMDDLSRREYKKLLYDVSQAWDIVRESIPSHSYPSPKGRVFVPREYCQQSISTNSSLAMLLPSLRGLGLCSYALVHFLLMKQNEFLQQYYQITGKEMSSIDTVDFCYASSLTLAHLISYDPDRDILPLILANSKYSFEVGKGTQVQYDFISFQHRLDSRFFQGKPLLRVEQVETVIFRTEVSSASVFKTLRDKIRQVSLWQGVKAQICKELRTVPDVCSALANVDVSISFLVSAPQQGELHLEDFMVNTLKMTEPLYSPKAKAHCQFKHVQALWLLLSLEKMRRLTHHGQDAFEGLEAVFLTELTEEQEDSLKKYLKKLKGNKLDLFTEQLHDCLVLRIAVTQDRTAEDFMDVEQTKLRDMLMGHVESSLYEDMAAPGIPLPDLYLQDFPEDILCKQTAAVLHQAICQERPSLHH